MLTIAPCHAHNVMCMNDAQKGLDFHLNNFFTLQTTNLLADIGGQLGLWIGISALTCGEILELIFQLLVLAYTKLKSRRQNRVIEIGQTTE